ncbi:MAG: efflux RND transporter periplasmic adaptor subunit [Candidatus Faecivicinus sp.]
MNARPVKKGKKWKRRLRRALTALVILLVIAGLAWYGYGMLKQEYTVTYDAYTASIGSISNALSFSGNLGLVNSADYAASASTTVRTVYVAAGDDVQKGDKLLRLANGTTISAEFDGRVNTLSVEEGDEVKAGDALIQVADFTHMQVTFRIDEYDIADVSIGQACTVTATATERSFDSEIASINYISSGGSVAYYSAVAYVDVGEGIYPGMQVTLSIPQEEARDVVVLKMDALSFDETNSAYVWMYNDEGVLERVDVEVGVSNGNYVEIVNGLSEGDVVYVEAEMTVEGSGLGGLLSGLFGSQQMNPPSGSTGGMRGNFGGGEMPSGFEAPGGGEFRGGMGGGNP